MAHVRCPAAVKSEGHSGRKANGFGRRLGLADVTRVGTWHAPFASRNLYVRPLSALSDSFGTTSRANS